MFKLMMFRRPFWVAVLLLSLTSGCGSWTGTTAADPSRAEGILHAALDAWKSGASQAELAVGTNPIHVSDLDWKNGLRLVRYEAAAEGRLVGFDMCYPVVLELKGPKGKTMKRTAMYMISTAALPLVLRQEG